MCIFKYVEINYDINLDLYVHIINTNIFCQGLSEVCPDVPDLDLHRLLASLSFTKGTGISIGVSTKDR